MSKTAEELLNELASLFNEANEALEEINLINNYVHQDQFHDDRDILRAIFYFGHMQQASKITAESVLPFAIRFSEDPISDLLNVITPPEVSLLLSGFLIYKIIEKRQDFLALSNKYICEEIDGLDQIQYAMTFDDSNLYSRIRSLFVGDVWQSVPGSLARKQDDPHDLNDPWNIVTAFTSLISKHDSEEVSSKAVWFRIHVLHHYAWLAHSSYFRSEEGAQNIQLFLATCRQLIGNIDLTKGLHANQFI